jgi:hypothetical protein
MEKVDVFNAATGGAIRLEYDRDWLAAAGGDHVLPVVFARPSGVDAHVDEADPASADTPASLSQAQGATVHQSRRAYLKWTRDEVFRGAMTPEQYSVAVGEFIADYKLLALRDNLLGIGAAAVDSMDTPSADYHVLNVARGKTAGAKVKFSFGYLNTLLGKMGDAREEIVAVVMHSAVFNDLVADGLSNYVIDTVAGAMIVRGVAQAMGRTLVVVDSATLYTELTSNYYTEYAVLGLGRGALTARIVSEDAVSLQAFDDKKVKYWTARQDYDVEYAVGGMKWTAAGTDVNPTDAELATAARWDEFLCDHRECKIVKGVFNAT